MIKEPPTNAVKAVTLNHEGAILLLQRNPATRGGESNWDLPGGLVEMGEDPVEALQREVAEELGVSIKVMEQAETWQFLRAKDNQIVHVQNYLCTITDGDIRLSDEHIQYQWVKPESLASYPVKHPSLYAALANLPRPIASARYILEDLLTVGPNKPLGYLPLNALREARVDVQQLEGLLLDKGLCLLRLTQDESSVYGGALYAYHEPSLRNLLTSRASILLAAGWPTNPVDFVRHLKVSAARQTPLFELIATAYADPSSNHETASND